MKAPIFVVLAFLVNSALAGIFSSSRLQRKFLGDSCKFQWTVTGNVTNVFIYNQTTGAPVAQNARLSQSHYIYIYESTIIMTITSIALWDAGNYTLSINYGDAWENDSSALLFVFVSGSVSLSQTLGRNLSTEGDSVELTCAFTSNSQPVAYRPGVVYSWSLSRFGTLQVLSNGSLQTPSGDIVSGYNTRNNGRTLTVSSVQYNDAAQYIYCYVKEDGSNLSSSNYFYINVQYVSRADFFPAVIALAIVLGIALLAIIGMLIGFFVWKRRHYISTSNSARPNQAETKESETDHYQEMDHQTSENRVYTNLDHTEGI